MQKRLFVIAVLTVLVYSANAGETILKEPESAVRPRAIKSTLPPAIQSAKVRAGAISTFPYIENFDVNDLTTDGWLISDPSITVLTSNSFNMQTGTLSGLPALSGSNYLISGYDTYASRNAWAFSPSISLTKGVTYHIYIYAYAKGYSGVKDEFKITVGTNQTSTTQTTVVIDKTGLNSVAISSWTKYEGIFTPTTTGNYNFGINHCTMALDVNSVAFENFVVSNSVYIEPPKVDIYSIGGLYSAIKTANNSVYFTAGEPINYIVKLANTSSFMWGFDATATPSSTTDSTSTVTYTTEGTHKATINAAGQGGNTIGTATHYMIRPVENVTSDIVYNFKSYDQLTTSYFTDNNYVVGPNSYYKKFAEKYSLPTNVSISISDIYLYLGAYNIASANQSNNVTISILKADGTGGLPGTVINTVTTTYANLFGTTTISSNTAKTYTFSTPVTVKGSFYIAIDFSTITTTNATNYIGIVSTTPRKYKDASFYLYYNSAWISSGLLIPNGQLSAYIAPKITFIPSIATSVESYATTKPTAYVVDNKLHIQQAEIGNSVQVFNIAGENVYSTVLNDNNSILPITLKTGMYIVKVADKVTKVFVK
jgi:hypothetical protein